MKLLVVDDSLIVRNAVERHARATRVTEIYTAQDGAIALQLFDAHHLELVTMDLTMLGRPWVLA